MSDKHFRVLLDLSELHEQNFKYVWINVSPRELKTISDFVRSILNKLSLKQKNIELFVRDGLLLDEETILVLREDDTVKVCYKKQLDHGDNPGTSSRKRNHSEGSADAVPQHSKRHKSESECFESNRNEEKQPRKRKNKKSQTMSLDMEEDNTAVLEESSIIKIKNNKEKDKSSTKLGHNVPLTKKDEAFFSFNVTEPLLNQNENIKHSSHKKNKTVSMKSIMLEPGKEINSVSVSLLNNNKTNCHQNEKVNENKAPEKKLTAECSEEQSCTRPKKKRKRRRKRKTVSESLVEPVAPDKTGADNEFESFSQSIDVNDKRKHIVYSSSEETQESYNAASQLQSCSNTFTVKEDNFVSNIQSVFNYPKVSTPAQSDSCGNPNWCVSLMQNEKPSTDRISDSKLKLDKSNEQLSQEKVTFSFSENSVSQNSNMDIVKTSSSIEIHENEHSLSGSYSTQNNKIAKKDTSFHKERRNASNLQNGSTSCDFTGDEKSFDKKYTSEKKHMTSDEKYKDFPTMNYLPKVGTRIAYKTLELDESYSPVISDYREGVVKSVNLKTDELEIELTKEIIKPGRTGKFENLKEDEIPSPDIITCDIARWSSIISPKCLS